MKINPKTGEVECRITWHDDDLDMLFETDKIFYLKELLSYEILVNRSKLKEHEEIIVAYLSYGEVCNIIGSFKGLKVAKRKWDKLNIFITHNPN